MYLQAVCEVSFVRELLTRYFVGMKISGYA